MTHSPALVISAYVRLYYSAPYLHLFYNASFMISENKVVKFLLYSSVLEACAAV
jgi:hypothetical protein